MLSESELEARRNFYENIFGAERILSIAGTRARLWPVANYKEKILGLIARGFKDPEKMIISKPQILGFSLENIDDKIRGLTERGFKDPHKIIASSPAILGYSFDNIDKKLKIVTRLRGNAEDFIKYSIVFIGMSSQHYIPILRRCRELGQEPVPRNFWRIYKNKSFL